MLYTVEKLIEELQKIEDKSKTVLVVDDEGVGSYYFKVKQDDRFVELKPE